jgi:hypothetical protein
MKNQNQGKILEKGLLWMFKAYAASYLALEEPKSKDHAKRIQKITK